MNTLHGESWKYSTRTVQSRRIKLCFTYNRLHTVSIYHVEAIRKWSYVNSKYCSHHQWKSVDYFLSFIATQKEKPLLLPNLSSFGWVCKRYCKLQYIEIMVEKKVRVDGSEIVVCCALYQARSFFKVSSKKQKQQLSTDSFRKYMTILWLMEIKIGITSICRSFHLLHVFKCEYESTST